MFKLDSEAELWRTFRPKDQAFVELGPSLVLPTLVRHYLAWTHPAGGRVFLVFAERGEKPTGIVFETDGGGRAGLSGMCDWCHCMGSGSQIGLLVARVNAKKTAGVYVCVDLSCRRKLAEQADRRGESVIPSLVKLTQRMGSFASEALKIDLARSVVES